MAKISRKDRPIGFFVPPGSDLEASIKDAQDNLARFVLLPLYHPRQPTGAGLDKPRCDLELKASDWYRCVALELPSKDFDTRPLDMFEQLSKAFSYTLHLGVGTTVWSLPASELGLTHFGRFVAAQLATLTTVNQCQLWVVVPTGQSTMDSSGSNGSSFEATNTVNGHNGGSDGEVLNGYGEQLGQLSLAADIVSVQKSRYYNHSEDRYTDSWIQWQHFIQLLPADRRVGLVLDITGDLPDERQQQRWCGELVRGVILHTRDFYLNEAGFPVLPTATQKFLILLMSATARKLNLLIRGNPCRSPKVPDLALKHYVMYLEHIRRLSKEQDEKSDPYCRGGDGYENYLQTPLQPLKDHLESQTYEVFERDPIKYEAYKRAIFLALEDKLKENQINKDWTPTIMVVGAGRGPLVDMSIRAINELKIELAHIFVVEKNPHALVTLRHRLESEWLIQPRIRVELIESDMRHYQCPRTADLVISELLGSFSDNELSPECLDGVWRSCSETTISIPQSYRSWLQPIQSARLHIEVQALRAHQTDKHYRYAFENNYVVYIKQAFRVGEPKMCFEFDHRQMQLEPNKRDNRRLTTLDWTGDIDYVLHGFAGYFDAELYGGIKLSTVPDQITPGMFSWFPIFFPIVQPIRIERGRPLSTLWYRFSDDRNVWYEWLIRDPIRSEVHNSKGRSLQIGL